VQDLFATVFRPRRLARSRTQAFHACNTGSNPVGVNLTRKSPGAHLSADYDAILLVSFGGPDQPEDVLPFLENVLRGRNVPRERMLDVARHYQAVGGVSPINAENRALRSALASLLESEGPRLPVYWGNRNWRPFLNDALQQMAADGVRRALAFVTSGFSSYSGCRQYLEDIERARADVGPRAPTVDKIRVFYNHPGFIGPTAEHVQAALDQIPGDRRQRARLVFTAHSIPMAMAANCRYEEQLAESCRLVAQSLERSDWRLVYQSRSGPPTQPWLGPDIGDYLRELHAAGEVRDLVLAPIGFLCDHVEVLYDLDTEARGICDDLGLNMLRAKTVGQHPQFVAMIRELILERLSDRQERRALGTFGPSHDVCPLDCCRSGRQRSE
jgi:ferrochelatase